MNSTATEHKATLSEGPCKRWSARLFAPLAVLVSLGLFAAGCNGSAIETSALPVLGTATDTQGNVDGAGDALGHCIADSDCLTLATTPCSQAVCEPTSHRCVVAPRPDHAACDDGEPCSAESACIGDACVAQKDTACDDGNPCTTDACKPGIGCVTTPNNQATCSDGNPCTTSDTCDGGACRGGNNVCACTGDADCVKIGGQDACSGALVCTGGLCVSDAAGPKDCDDKNPCTIDGCGAQGCTHVPGHDGSTCDDGNVCTADEVCQKGACTSAHSIVCSGGTGCATACDPKLGCAAPADVSATCDDGAGCTSNDTCAGGLCIGQPTCGCATDADCPAPPACEGTAACVAGVCTLNPATAVPCPQTGLGSCQENLCTATGCKVETALAGVACHNGACGAWSVCDANGTCLASGGLDCDDANPCTVDACDSKTGCTHLATESTANCDDGNACTTGEACAGGACIGGKGTCSDGDPCTGDLCDPGLPGLCAHTTIADGHACLDGDPCRAGGVCQGAKCVGGVVQDCDDLNPCTVDLCIASTTTAGPSCQHLPGDVSVACDDGDYCTTGDTCASGTCVGTAGNCACAVDSDCAAFDDGNLCNGSKHCVDHQCVVDPATVVTCPLPLSACVTETCVPNTGICNETPVTLSASGTPAGCEDGNFCTTGDLCANGVCLPGTPTTCDDADPCTNDVCDPTVGCAHLPFDVTAAIPCDDGNGCTQGDVCGATGCQAGVNTCQCQVDSDCAILDDKDLCNGQLICQNHACVPDGNVVTCPATGSLCVSSVCLPESGTCVTATVTDGTACADVAGCSTGGQCQGGTCLGAIVGCDDLNGCTVDACGPTGCTHLPSAGTPCDDGEACTSGDTCNQTGQCAAGPNTCTCSTDADCPSDGDLCNGVYACNAGVCLPKVGSVVTCDPAGNNPCQTNTCNPTTGVCLFVGLPTGATCDDANACTTGETCQQGACDGKAQVCDDQNPCTDDGCSPANGCFHLNSQKACDDGNPCSVGDVCSGGACVAGPGSCDCQLDSDCKDDGNLCNGIPTCASGKCTVLQTSVVQCDPTLNTACTVQACDVTDGKCKATNVPDNSGCDDGSVCTLQDRCVGGTCTGTAASCDDKNGCTTDSCDALAGCANTPNTATCDDGDSCTTGDICAGGACTAGANTCAACTIDADCVDDGNLCNGLPSCQGGLCKPKAGSAVTCPAASGCQTFVCAPATGACNAQATADGTACDDDNVCSATSACFGGACVGNVTANCDDKNPCTTDTCDPKAGCLHAAATGPCDDGNPCTSGDACGGGACLSGNNTCECQADGDCAKFEDGNACNGTLFCAANKCAIRPGTVITCDATQDTACVKNTCAANTGLCAPVASKDGSACTDGSFCTVSDACAGGTCQGVALDCSDSNPCTTDACDATVGCVHKAADGGVCDDGNGCTSGDTCQAGACVGSGACQCATDIDCGAFEDGNLCNGTLQCKAGQCVVNAATIVTCGTGAACTVQTCEPKSGTCLATSAQDGTVCGGPSLCGGSGTCAAGVCKGTSGCADDGNACTSAVCDGKGTCTQTPITGACSDGNTCTVGDTCDSGQCVPGANQCNCATDGDCAKLDDGNLCNGIWTCNAGQCAPNAASVVTCPASPNTCTTNVCQPTTGKCAAANAANGTACDDGNACTGAGQCFAGNCLVGQVSCDDQNPCTTDSCNAGSGCVHTNLGNFPPNTCDDGDPCTPISICQNGACTAPFNNCFCQTDSQCQDDGDLCNGKPTCQGGTCKTSAATIVVCDTSKDTACVKSTCQTATGTCLPAPVANGTACSDGSTCTGGDVCSGGTCIGITTDCNDNVACTADSCDPKTGCIHTAVAVTCDDGNACTTDTCDIVGGCTHAPSLGNACNDGDLCTTGEVCGVNAQGGVCQGGTAVDCDDGELCTTDSCDAKGGCIHTPTDFLCDDGNACTTQDTCAGGKCGGTAVTCDDSNPCTSDTCDQKAGCLNAATAGKCDDGNVCTSGDTCTGGACVGGVVLDCNDNNACTTDACIGDGTCGHTLNVGNACNDGSACTAGDTCQAGGGCAGVASVNCDDGNACTTDACQAVDGACDHTATAAGSVCSDGNPCTAPDACDGAGKCATSATDCNDNNDCTVDACDASTGQCTHTPSKGFSAQFDDGTFGSITTQSFNAQESWQLDTLHAVSGTTALYIGRVLLGTHTYNVGPNAATANLPSINVPKDIATATLTMQVWYDRDPSETAGCAGFVDNVAVTVDGAIGTQLCASTGAFRTVTIDLTGKAGAATAIGINFIANTTANNGQGAWIDDINVSWTCKP